MTATTQTGLNFALALAIPAAGLAYMATTATVVPSRLTASAMVALGLVWLASTVALNTVARPRPAMARLQHVDPIPVPPRNVVNVSRPLVPRTWKDALSAPLELLAVVWGVPLVILLVIAPIGLAISLALWLGGMIVGR